jgi:hypothetical protein
MKLNTYPISKYLLNEDSGNKDVIKKIIDRYGDIFHIIRSPKNEGLLKSVDNLYSLVETPYIFHCEDDWLFKSNPNFIKESLDILEDNSNINQVWIREGIPTNWLEFKNKNFSMVKQSHFGDWCGFSFNPGLRRLSDYKRIFPNGYNSLNVHGTNSALSEHECNQVAAINGYRAAIINNPACKHSGEGKSTYK